MQSESPLCNLYLAEITVKKKKIVWQGIDHQQAADWSVGLLALVEGLKKPFV